MATLPTQIKPGDLITSDFMNALLDEIAQLRDNLAPTGSQVVPNLFGSFLADARALIQQPARQLALGFVFDVSGAAIDPYATANANRVVLNQSPLANSRVAPNTAVNLVVSMASGSGTTTLPGPVIDHFETVTGTIVSSISVSSAMVIVGANFSANPAQDIVRFDGIQGIVTVDPSDPTRRLFVTIPTGIPGAPVSSSDSPKTGVVVSIQTPNGSPATSTITVNPPLSTQPKIISVSPLTQYENSDITIAGTNFTADAQVLIRDVSAVIVGTPTATQIIATVPDFGLPVGPPVPATVKVVVNTVPDIFTGSFKVRPSN